MSNLTILEEPVHRTPFWTRLKLALQVFNIPTILPVVELENGVRLDIKNGQLIIPGDFQLHATGTLKLTSDKHVVIQSAQNPDPERPGYIHAVWLNPNLDEQGRPLKDEEGDDAES